MNRPPDWLLAVVLAIGVFLWQRTAFPLWMIDLLPIQLAAYQWEHGEIEGMYAPVEKFDEWFPRWEPVAKSLGGEGFGNPYFYPPFVAALLSPFSEVDAKIWRNVLVSINVLLIFVNAWFIILLTGAERTHRNFLWCIALVLLCFPISRATKLGQIVPMLAALTWIGLFWLRANKLRPAGAMLGIVGAIKLFPIGIVALPFLTKRWNTVIMAGVVFVAIYGLSFVVLGLQVHKLFWEAVNEFRELTYPYFGNQSLVGWFARLTDDTSLTINTPYIVPYIDARLEIAKNMVLALVALPTLAWIAYHGKGYNRNSFPAFAGLLLAGMMLSLATAWEHYWLWLLPVLGWAIHEEWTRNESRVRLVWIFLASFFFLMKLTRFYTNSDLGRVISGSQTLGMLMLWLWLFYRVRRAAVPQMARRVGI